MEELSKYEQQRLEHIRRNQEFLVSMGLADAKAELASATKKTPAPPQKRTKVQVPESLRRRSQVGADSMKAWQRVGGGTSCEVRLNLARRHQRPNPAPGARPCAVHTGASG